MNKSIYLDNPVYHALLTGDASKALGTAEIKYFEKEISPFVGFEDGYSYIEGFNYLYNLFPGEREILYATRNRIDDPQGWRMIRQIAGSQFVLAEKKSSGKLATGSVRLVALTPQHADEMVSLAALTRPGPFNKRTIEFGNYFGIFENNKLVAMTGERLHIHNFTEVSAVCTHPEYLGKGYASLLLEHQVDLILASGQTPILHVKADNERAIFLYEKLGFKLNGPMNFYFLKKN